MILAKRIFEPQQKDFCQNRRSLKSGIDGSDEMSYLQGADELTIRCLHGKLPNELVWKIARMVLYA